MPSVKKTEVAANVHALRGLAALDHACECFRDSGGQLGLAAAIGVASPSISGWRKTLRRGNPRGIPQERCEPIEVATEGRTRVEELRGDLLWQRDPEGRVIGVITPITPTRRRRVRA